MLKICVVGAGVSGLSTAIELSKRGHDVSIVADAQLEATTSSAAAAFWYPFWTGLTPDHSWYRPAWAWHSFLQLDDLARDSSTGITPTPIAEYFDSDMAIERVEEVIDSMWWSSMRRLKFRPLLEEEVSDKRLGAKRFQSGITFDTLVVNMKRYLPFLQQVALEGDVRIFSPRHLEAWDLQQFVSEYNYVINCTGIGAIDLVQDPHVIPVEGIVVRVSYSEDVRKVTLIHTGDDFGLQPVYIVPRGSSDIILGGTINDLAPVAGPRHYEGLTLPEHEVRVQREAHRIYRWCCSLERALESCEILGVSVGYRPSRRPVVRLEVDPEFDGKLIHNYGHGGGGITLSWGCAREVCQWIEWLR